VQVEADEKRLQAKNVQLKEDKASVRAEQGMAPPVFSTLDNARAVANYLSFSMVFFHGVCCYFDNVYWHFHSMDIGMFTCSFLMVILTASRDNHLDDLTRMA